MTKRLKLLMYIYFTDGREIRAWKKKDFTKWFYEIQLWHKDLGLLDTDKIDTLEGMIEIIQDLMHGQEIEKLRITSIGGVRIEKKLKEAFKDYITS